MFVYTFSDMIAIGLIGIGVAIIALGAIWYFVIAPVIHKLFMHNCYTCEHYYLSNVAGCGDRCWHKCKLHNYEDASSMNCWNKWRRCKTYERKHKKHDN